MPPNPYLRGKHAFYAGDVRSAVAALEEILGPDALSVSDTSAASQAAMPFESFVSGLLAGPRHLRISFETAIERAWSASRPGTPSTR